MLDVGFWARFRWNFEPWRFLIGPDSSNKIIGGGTRSVKPIPAFFDLQ